MATTRTTAAKTCDNKSSPHKPLNCWHRADGVDVDEMVRLTALLDEAAAELKTMLRTLPAGENPRMLRTSLFDLETASYNLERNAASGAGEGPSTGSGASG